MGQLRWRVFETISVSLMCFLCEARGEYCASQELNASNVNHGQFCTVFIICRVKHRTPERGMSGLPRSKMRVRVVRNRVEGGDGQINE